MANDFSPTDATRIAKTVKAFENARTNARVPGPGVVPIKGGGDPLGQYEGMAKVLVSQNQWGAKFISASSVTQGGGSGSST